MLIDGIRIAEGSTVLNLVIPTGTSFPGTPNVGEAFYLTGAGEGLYTYGSNSTWNLSSGGGTVAEPSNQIVYGTDTGVASSSEFTYNPNSGAFVVAPSAMSAPGNIYLHAAESNGSTFDGGSILITGGTSYDSNSGGGVNIYAGQGGASNGPGGNTTVSGGYGGATNGHGGRLRLVGGSAEGTGTGGDVNIEGGTSATGNGGNIILLTTSVGTTPTERFRITRLGAWSVGSSGTSYGTTGQVLTSAGSSSPPTWATPSGGTPAGSDTQIQYNNGGIFGASSNFTYNSTIGQLIFAPNSVANPGNSSISAANNATSGGSGAVLLLTGGNGFGTGSGGGVAINGGVGGATGGGGSASLVGGNGQSGGIVFIRGGSGTSSGGVTQVTGGGGITNGNGGNVEITGGVGAGAGTHGAITFTTSSVRRAKILANGAWAIGLADTDYGTPGQALVSNGNAAPTWQTVSSATAPAGGSNTQLQYNNSGILGGIAELTYNSTSKALSYSHVTDISSPGDVTITTPNALVGSNGGNISLVCGHSGGSTTNNGGAITIQTGFGSGGGHAGNLHLTGSGSGSGNSGSVNISGGSAGGGGNAGSINIIAGNATGTWSGSGGSVTLQCGTKLAGAASHGNIIFKVSTTEVYRINSSGALSIGTSGTNYGTSGQVLTSQGNTAPTWQTLNYLQVGGGTLTGALTLNADPTVALGAATKQYVDNLAAGLDPKGSVRVATITNIDLSSAPAAIDGVTLTSGNRVLVKDQSTASQNGIYVFNGASSAMTRSTDADGSPANEVSSGMYCFSTEGTSVGLGWILTTPDPITLGTTALTFTEFSSSLTTPGGSDTQLQYNNAGSFGGLSNGTSGQVLVSNGPSTAPAFADVPVPTNVYTQDEVHALLMILG